MHSSSSPREDVQAQESNGATDEPKGIEEIRVLLLKGKEKNIEKIICCDAGRFEI